ncbi:MAG: hypothetical protein ACI9MU_004264 [Alphaproteobacteria bacterium]|jgi:hypothetical protein
MYARHVRYGSKPAVNGYRGSRPVSGAKRPSNVQRMRDKASSTRIKIDKVLADVLTRVDNDRF